MQTRVRGIFDRVWANVPRWPLGRRVLAHALCGSFYVAAATLTGCAMTMTLTRWPHPAAQGPTTNPSITSSAARANVPAFADPADIILDRNQHEAPHPPTINVFGEFNGKP